MNFNESNNANLKDPKIPPIILFMKPKKTIFRSLVISLPIIEISTIINKKVKTNEAILR